MYTSELEAHTWANQGPNGPHEDPMEGTLHKCGTNVMGWLHKSGTTSMTRPLHRSLTQRGSPQGLPGQISGGGTPFEIGYISGP